MNVIRNSEYDEFLITEAGICQKCNLVRRFVMQARECMEKFYKMVEASNKRFPEGVQPYQMITRLLEEAGEVAAEVNHWEGSVIKRLKHGEPCKEKLANELRQAMVELFKIAVYYSVEKELEDSINQSLLRAKSEGLIE